MKTFLIVISILIYSTTSGNTQVKYIHCGGFFNGITKTIEKDVTVVVDGKKIVEVVNRLTEVPADAKYIDLREYTFA